MQLLHRIRERTLKHRTALSNQLRGLLAEYGIVLPKSIHTLRSRLPGILEDATNELTTKARLLFKGLYEELKQVDERLVDYEQQLILEAKADERCQRLMKIEGIGVISATAAVASIVVVSLPRETLGSITERLCRSTISAIK